MPSEEVMAMSGEIDAAITAMNEEESTRGDFTDDTSKVEKTENVVEETQNIEETVRDEEGGITEDEDSIREETSGPNADETTEDVADGVGSASGRGGSPSLPQVKSLQSPHNEYIIERAVAAGIPYADATALTPASLERVVSAREAAYEDQVAVNEPPASKEPEKDLFADIPVLDKENFDPEVVDQIEAMKEAMRSQYGSQQKELQEFRDGNSQAQEAINQASLRELEVWFDGQVNELGENFKDVLGEGKFMQLDRNSTQFAKRNEIADQMSIMHAGYQAQGIQPPAREDLFDTASRIVLRDKYTEVREEVTKGKLAKQSTQHMKRAGGGKAKMELSDEDAIAAEIDAKFG